MNRAVVVLLLLIANAIVSSSKVKPPAPAPPARPDNYSLGLFTILDGGSVRTSDQAGSCCIADRTRDDARTPIFDVRL